MNFFQVKNCETVVMSN